MSPAKLIFFSSSSFQEMLAEGDLEKPAICLFHGSSYVRTTKCLLFTGLGWIYAVGRCALVLKYPLLTTDLLARREGRAAYQSSEALEG
ncbi:unnamed protein product [Sphagnum jensenii]|uniref:Uncharacterized protein n=1 Tax=Sphagnum jensenii TaxID=128206 RepID=A0ABP1BLY8_9BRYO